MNESDPKRNSTGSLTRARTNEFQQDSGRASRARTQLIVDGFSNLAIIATFFAGVQAQLISVTNDENEGAVAVATNAAFFGGLIFSVFTAVLATLSARWFSILREDDADYLSSRWLCQDSRMKEEPPLQNYLDYQIQQLEKIEQGEGQGFNPVHFDAKCIIQLLKQEKGNIPSGETDSLTDRCTIRERILSVVLLSPLIACLPSFALFTTGILLLAWDRQPLPVAIFTSVTVLVCVIPLCGFFIKHRHKHVIRHIYLGRPSL